MNHNGATIVFIVTWEVIHARASCPSALSLANFPSIAAIACAKTRILQGHVRGILATVRE